MAVSRQVSVEKDGSEGLGGVAEMGSKVVGSKEAAVNREAMEIGEHCVGTHAAMPGRELKYANRLRRSCPDGQRFRPQERRASGLNTCKTHVLNVSPCAR